MWNLSIQFNYIDTFTEWKYQQDLYVMNQPPCIIDLHHTIYGVQKHSVTATPWLTKAMLLILR